MTDSEQQHFTGTVWRPPYEAHSVLLQATVGCTHHACKFCSLYGDLRFRLSPPEEIEADLRVVALSIMHISAPTRHLRMSDSRFGL